MCSLLPMATFSLPALPTFLPLVFISLLAAHSLPLFPSSLSLQFLAPRLLFFFSLRPQRRRGFLLKAVAAVRSAGQGGTQKEAVLFRHTRSLCGCQPPVAALGMVCMCWAYGGSGHTSGKDWGGRRRAWNWEVEELTLGSRMLKSNTDFSEERQLALTFFD